MDQPQLSQLISVNMNDGKVTVDRSLLDVVGMHDALLFAIAPFTLMPDLTPEVLAEVHKALTIAAENHLASRN